MKKPITSFRGEHRFLSNFWPVRILYQGTYYPSVEHAYQAAKTLDAKDRRRIAKAVTAGHAKAIGYKVKVRPQWEKIKVEVMEELLRLKFKHKALARNLKATGDSKLIEGNTWNDAFWGVCDGKGDNHLGKLLMKIRSELCEEAKDLDV